MSDSYTGPNAADRRSRLRLNRARNDAQRRSLTGGATNAAIRSAFTNTECHAQAVKVRQADADMVLPHVTMIRERRLAGASLRDLARDFGLSTSAMERAYKTVRAGGRLCEATPTGAARAVATPSA